MIQIAFSPDEMEELNYWRYPHPKAQKKMDVLYLKSQGLRHKEILRLCQISELTLTIYLKQYLQDGIEGLKKLGYMGKGSEQGARSFGRIRGYFLL